MSVLNTPNTFVTGTTINAAPFNTNFSAVATAVNNIDATNIGAVGLYASNLLPTNAAQATFGGTTTYTFPAALNVGSNAIATTAGDGGFARSTTTGELIIGGSGSALTLDWGVASPGNGTFTQPSGFFRFLTPVTASSNSVINAFVPPVYTAAGAALAATTHIATGSGTGNGATQTITLTGAAVFSSATSYQGYVGGTGAVGSIVQLSGTQFQVTLSNGLAYQYFLIGS